MNKRHKPIMRIKQE